MKALIYIGQRKIQLSRVDVPVAQEDEAVIRVTDAGLCQTQVNEFIEGPFIIKQSSHKTVDEDIPLIVGHEFGGIVESVGNPNNEGLIGKQVAVLPLQSCGKCKHCRNGQENLCDELNYYGLIGKDGGFAEYACVKTDNLFIVEDKSLLTFIEPLLVAIHAGNILKQDIQGKAICVLGAGTIGLCTAAVFRDYFGGSVVIKEILPNRIRLAQEAGFQVVHTLEPDDEFDVVADCAGNNPTSRMNALTEGFSYLKKSGILLNMGTYFHSVSVLPASLLIHEHKLVSSYLYDLRDVRILPQVLKSISIDFSKFILAIPLNNIIEEGYYRAEVDKDSFTRLVVVP